MKKISRLKKLAGLRHFSDFTVVDLVSAFGMYESAIIDLSDIEIIERSEGENGPRAEVAKDVKALNKFLYSDEAIMLPCPDCGREQAFRAGAWNNPIKQVDTSEDNNSKVGMKRFPIMSEESRDRHHNVFELSKPYFAMNIDVLCDLNENDLEKL
ncbi:hypothetical protein [Butyrivibrio sp. INlla14]|uniref:hypothetical protein n=1 Tax=Butyrivibrio sp. INlla14 TaxID=1520808 RepID=UPI000876F6DF|nr:hypothetical protein [Butyrivibrio sp. INlla14]SCY14326.1 hypothetical protein SAMN02910371_01201 [Butyrivibrio sp. INlla14]